MSGGLRYSAAVLLPAILAVACDPAGAEPEAVRPLADRGPAIMSTALRSTDLDRSIQYYTTGLGMVVAGKIHHGPVIEVILNFEGKPGQAGILLFRDETPGKSPPVEEGNAAGRIIIRSPDVAEAAARLTTAGFSAGDVHGNGNVKILDIHDPDGHSFELVELPTGDVKLKGSPP